MLLSRRALLQAAALPTAAQSTAAPWYRRAYRWGQTNITEQDPARYDIDWWRGYWKRTAVQAVIINAGGIVAYYPSRFPLHYRAQFLNNRDLLGELTTAAHSDGLWVMARMDSNRAANEFFREHPSWFARDRQGEPVRAADKYIACIHSPYYEEYLPGILREIGESAHPDGFTDNSWAGLGRDTICYCEWCRRKFEVTRGTPLPDKPDWDDPAYRAWILWNYARRLEIWDLNNRVTREVGGKDCIWSGMCSGSVTTQARSFRDLREIARRASILMLDHQRRDNDTGFQQNGDTGKRVHELMGWDRLAPESMALYLNGPGYYRVASKPPAEARHWMLAGLAGGIQPWWHHIGAYHEDRRMYHTAVPVMQWAKENESLLHNRQPVASVGLVWSQRNTDFFGRDDAAYRVDAPYTGFMHALVRARIPYLPVHADDIRAAATRFSVLILPNLGALSDSQCNAIRRFAEQGGSIIATGVTSLYDEWGTPRSGFALADLFAAQVPTAPGPLPPREPIRPTPSLHTYLRLHPELRAQVDGPRAPGEPAIQAVRHPVLSGFDETDLIPFGATLTPLQVDARATVPLTYVPPFPTYPPETAWMREPVTSIPGLGLSSHGKAHVAYMPAQLDARYYYEHLPDHANLLTNLVRWAAGESIPLHVDGPGLLDCHLYTQGSAWIIHLLNLTSAATWRAPLEELIPVGPLRVKVRLPPGVRLSQVEARVQRWTRPLSTANQTVTFEVRSLLDHEMLVLR